MLSSKCVRAKQKEDIMVDFLNEVNMEEETDSQMLGGHRTAS
jgi:hypothetical protein